MPKQIYQLDYPQYFSGAGYIIKNELMMEMAIQKENVTMIPLDDVYIGAIIEKVGKKIVQYPKFVF